VCALNKLLLSPLSLIKNWLTAPISFWFSRIRANKSWFHLHLSKVKINQWTLTSPSKRTDETTLSVLSWRSKPDLTESANNHRPFYPQYSNSISHCSSKTKVIQKGRIRFLMTIAIWSMSYCHLQHTNLRAIVRRNKNSKMVLTTKLALQRKHRPWITVSTRSSNVRWWTLRSWTSSSRC